MKAHYNEAKLADYIPLSELRRMVKRMENDSDDMPLTFEFLCTAFFPKIWQSVQDKLKDSYTQGYIDGRNSKNEN